MRDYQTAFTLKDLRKFIEDLPSNTKLVIHDKDGNTIIKPGKEIRY